MCFRRMTEHVIKCMNRQPQRIFDSVKNGSPANGKWSAALPYTKYRRAHAVPGRADYLGLIRPRTFLSSALTSWPTTLARAVIVLSVMFW
jgi:hypothetical protein